MSGLCMKSGKSNYLILTVCMDLVLITAGTMQSYLHVAYKYSSTLGKLTDGK